MAYTKTDIANQALLRLGEKTITSIDDEAEPAPTLKLLLDSTAREIQASFPWQELVRRVEISEDPDLDADGRHRYALPADTLRVMAINPASNLDPDFDTEGNFILTDELSPVTVEYLRYEDDPGSWGHDLARATYTQLASAAALALTQNAGVAERAGAEAMKALDEGRRRQSTDNQPHSYLPRWFGWRQSRRRRFW